MFNSYEAKLALNYFHEITKIPHGSGNEKAVSDYVKNFAVSLGLKTIQDDMSNLIVFKDASPGFENNPAIILQAHLDMVCEKNSDTVHDFTKDPLDIYIDGDFLKARGTTLGADNGIAVSLFMALMEDCKEHPPLEFVFTTEEETGMGGAMELDVSALKGKYMINLDADNDAGFVMGCAAGTMIKYSLPVSYVKPCEDSVQVKISVSGLTGGHSGMDIHKSRAHAIKLIGIVLAELDAKVCVCVKSLKGGMKVNAIPREAFLEAAIPTNELAKAKEIVKKLQEQFSSDFRLTDPKLQVAIEKINEEVCEVLDDLSKQRLISSLQLFPNGVLAMSSELASLVNSSCNLGVAETTADKIILSAMPRGATKYYNERVENAVVSLGKLTDAEMIFNERSPAWPYNPFSKLLDFAKKSYVKVFGVEPTVSAVHAGLECGLFAEKIQDLDIISFGAVTLDLHTPDERVSISSVGRVWKFLLELLSSRS